MRFTALDPYGKPAAASFFALDRHIAAVESSQFLYQRQTNTCAFMRSRTRAANAVKPLEHFRQIRIGNTDPCVADSQLDVAAALFQHDCNLPLECEFESVA